MTENHGYTLRCNNSPYRKRPPSPKTKRRKSKISNDEQIIFDAVNVATYNDSPKHMYGLDKNMEDDNLRITRTQNMNSTCNPERKVRGIKLSFLQLQWHLMILYFVFAVIVLEGSKRILYTGTWQLNGPEGMRESNNTHKIIERLIEQISIQKQYMDEFSDAIKHLEANQQASCGCEKLNALFGEEKKMQKGAVENMQQQILTTIDLVKSLNDRVTTVQQTIQQHEEKMNKQKDSDDGELCQGEDCRYTGRNIFASIQSALETYHADVLGLTDFALETAGGSIHSSHHSDTCEVGAPIIKVFGLPLWQDPRSPRTVIRSDKSAGKCWPMKGSSGFIVIKLAVKVHVTLFSLEHLDQRLDKYSNNMYQSAPKEFEVYAWLDKEGKVKIKLGAYVYLRDQSPIQTFKVQVNISKPVNYVELRILSNYGNRDCTCLYRFRVHGTSHEWDGSL